MNRTSTRLFAWSLAAVGMLAGHAVGYGLVDVAGAPDHGYFSVLAPLITVGAVAALIGMAVRTVRRLDLPPIRFQALLAAQLVLYATVEILEHVAGGQLSSIHSWPVALGLLAQIPVAALLVALVRVTVEIAERVAGLPSRPRHRDPFSPAPRPALLWVSQQRPVPVGLRGPPLPRQS